MSNDTGDINLSSKVPGKITEVSSLFDNRTSTVVIGTRGQGEIQYADRGFQSPLGFEVSLNEVGWKQRSFYK